MSPLPVPQIVVRALFVSLAAMTVPLRAEIVLDMAFTDPDNTLSGQEEAMGRGNFRGKNISTPTHASAIPIKSTASQNSSPGLVQSLQILTTPPMAGPFFRATQKGGVFDNRIFCGLEITPEYPDASFAVISSVERDKVLLDGGFDFFLRATQEPETGSVVEFKILDCGTKDGLRLTLSTNNSRGCSASLIKSDAECFDTDLDGASDAKQVSTVNSQSNAKAIENGKIYHVAVGFTTGPDGVITMRTFLKEGLGPIDPTSAADLNGEVKFRLLNPSEKLKAGLSPDKFIIGTYPFKPAPDLTFTLDLASFRIFKPSPTSFPGLDQK